VVFADSAQPMMLPAISAMISATISAVISAAEAPVPGSTLFET